jgi:hypothetical protein
VKATITIVSELMRQKMMVQWMEMVCGVLPRYSQKIASHQPMMHLVAVTEIDEVVPEEAEYAITPDLEN